MSLDCYSGDIPARSKQTIRGIIKPQLRCQYSFDISYQLLMPELSQQETEKQPLISVCIVMYICNSNSVTVAYIYITAKRISAMFSYLHGDVAASSAYDMVVYVYM